MVYKDGDSKDLDWHELESVEDQWIVSTTNIPPEDQWSVSSLKSPRSNISNLRMKLAEDDDLVENNLQSLRRSSKLKAFCALPT